MTTYRYTGYMTDGSEVTRIVIASDGDEAKRLGRQSAEVDGRRVVLQTVKVVEETNTLPSGSSKETK